MRLDRVTITGADDSVEPESLLYLSRKFPFVEWGILLARSHEGMPRFPSLPWLWKLMEIEELRPKLSGHLCGPWVRELCAGDPTFTKERPTIAHGFSRIQLNFHSRTHLINKDKFVNALKSWSRDDHCRYIFQFDGVNDDLINVALEERVEAVPLFDTSGGEGIEPPSWPKSVAEYCGYAGGLHPDRIQSQLSTIAIVAGDSRIWIDVETHVRSEGAKYFDLSKVERFLDNCEPFVEYDREEPDNE